MSDLFMHASMVAQVALGLLFSWSFVGKARSPSRFISTVVSYELLPPRLARLAGWLLIPAELFVAVTLTFGVADRVGGLLALGLLLVFAVAVGISWRRGRDHACGCFDSEERISGHSLVRLAVLIPLGAIVVAGPPGGLVRALGTGDPWAPGYVGAVLAMAVVLLGTGHLVLESLRLVAVTDSNSPKSAGGG